MTAKVCQRNGSTCHFSPYRTGLTTIRKVRSERESYIYYCYCNQKNILMSKQLIGDSFRLPGLFLVEAAKYIGKDTLLQTLK